MDQTQAPQPSSPKTDNQNVTGSATISKPPTTWPGAFGVYKYSKEIVKLNLWTLIIIAIIAYAVNFVLQFLLAPFGGLLSIIPGAFFSVCFTLIYLAGSRQEKPTISKTFNEAVPFWLRMIGLELLVGVTIFISVLLFIIPVFFVAPRLSLATYFLVDKNLGVVDAYKASWEATKGNVGKIYGIFGAGFLMALLFVTIIGIPFSIYFLVMYSAATVFVYRFIQSGSPKPAMPNQQAVQPTTPVAQ